MIALPHDEIAAALAELARSAAAAVRGGAAEEEDDGGAPSESFGGSRSSSDGGAHDDDDDGGDRPLHGELSYPRAGSNGRAHAEPTHSFTAMEGTVPAGTPDTHLEQWAFEYFGRDIGSRRKANMAARQGCLLVNGETTMPSRHVVAGDKVTFLQQVERPLGVAERELVVEACDAGQRVLRWAVRAFKDVLCTKGQVRRALGAGEVTIGSRPVEETRLLKQGDVVRLRHDLLAAETRRDGIALDVCYEDAHMAVVWKPSGMDTNGKSCKTVELALPHNLQPQSLSCDGGALQRPRPVHRLDRATSGLVLCAKTIPARDGLCKLLESHGVQKRYRAIVLGRAGEVGEEFTVCNPVGGRHSESRCRVVHVTRCGWRDTEWITTMDLWPLTGRRHQLRQHMIHRGHPIVGDTDSSAATKSNVGAGKGLFLAAVQVSLPHPCDEGQHVVVERPEPAKFDALRQRESRLWSRKYVPPEQDYEP